MYLAVKNIPVRGFHSGGVHASSAMTGCPKTSVMAQYDDDDEHVLQVSMGPSIIIILSHLPKQLALPGYRQPLCGMRSVSTY